MLTRLAELYDTGQGVAHDPETGFAWRLRAAQQGRVDAQVIVANCYANGHGVAADEGKAAHWCEKAAEKGHSEAIYDIAKRYDTGIGVEQNDEMAVKWLEIAAREGNAFACFKMGRRALLGQGIEVDTIKALEWFDSAADKGHVEAQAAAGIQRLFPQANESAEEVCVEEDTAKQTTGGVAHSAAEPVEQTDRERFLAQERLIERGKSLARGLQMLQAAAAQGHAGAGYHLALCYSRGIGTEMDLARAFECFVQAATKDPESMYCVALCYAKGRGVDQDHTRATMWYEKAAKAGHIGGQYHYARRLEKGVGCLRDELQSLTWYLQSAQQGRCESQYTLGKCYAQGLLGVHKDLNEASKWFGEAADQGDPEALKAKAMVDKKLVKKLGGVDEESATDN